MTYSDRMAELSEHLSRMRIAAAALKSPPGRREALMLEFARQHRRRRVPSWAWTLAAAAAIAIAVLIGHEAGLHSARVRRVNPRRVDSGRAVLYEASADASALSTDDFVAIPYTPPLAQGEMVRMVHAEMYPEALASLGVAVAPGWTGHLPVDMVVGEDGMPRAIRISDNGK
ncbi:MAG: hypothetical protein M3N93_05390 [Acidobacteriota bacterium]|nr:hypothetical protein [Acidobacteriota bacterium]